MPDAPATILFDLDGTLIHSAPDVCHAVNHVFEDEGLAPLGVRHIQVYLGQGARVLMERALRDHGHDRDTETLDRMTSDFLAFYAANPVVHTTVFPGVFETLEQLRSENAAIAICTNKPFKTTVPVLEALGLGGQFDAVVCPDHVTNRKPHGDHVLQAIRACDGQQENAVMVGDSENDIDAAIHAGVPSIAVTFGYTNVPVKDLGADQIIDSFDGFFDALRAIRG